MSDPRPVHGLGRAALAAALLGVLLAGLATPLLGLVFEADAGAGCCSGGRCCCREDDAPRPEGPCLTAGCGCSRPETSTAAAPLRIEALLPALDPPACPEPGRRAFSAARGTPHSRPDEPLVPPPRHPRSA
jgi:hypothetical protein